MADAPSAQMISLLRNQAFEEIGRVAVLAESYVRSLEEAAFRGDDVTMLVHLKQTRLCCMSMIKTYKDTFEADHEGLARGQAESAQRNRSDHRVGDGDERG
jgi:hypothetical protein